MKISEFCSLLLVVTIIAAVYATELLFLAVRITCSITESPCSPLFYSEYFIILHILALVGIGCFLYGFLIEPRWIDTTRFELETAKLKNTRLRIVLFSDTHCETKPRNEHELVEIVNSLDADVIVFTGDSVNRPEALPLFRKTLKLMNARIGKFAVRGNLDSNFWPELDFFSGTGFRELAADAVKVEKDGETFYVTGFNVPFPENFQSVLRKVPADSHNILLYHRADLAESLENLNIDLYLSGHTHGGQIRLPFYGAVITLSRFGKKYEAGMYTIGPTKLYINRGIGLERKPAPPARFLCRPEISVFDIIPPKAAQER